jgi:hypothetical protein
MPWWLAIAGVLLAAAPTSAQEASADTAPLPPKVAVVVAGDPDDTLREIATFLETECKLSGLRTPTDQTLSGAMRGEPATDEDGLEGLRSIRRGLGLDPAKDLESYKRIGMTAGADALVVLRRQGVVSIEVFDVSAAQLYEGTLGFAQSTSEQRLRFIRSRAIQAQLRWSAPPSGPAEAAPAETKPETEQAEQGKKDEREESRAKRRWKKAWPYVVAGALLAGGVTYLIIDRRRDDEVGPPLLRFRPGEE